MNDALRQLYLNAALAASADLMAAYAMLGMDDKAMGVMAEHSAPLAQLGAKSER